MHHDFLFSASVFLPSFILLLHLNLSFNPPSLSTPSFQHTLLPSYHHSTSLFFSSLRFSSNFQIFYFTFIRPLPLPLFSLFTSLSLHLPHFHMSFLPPHALPRSYPHSISISPLTTPSLSHSLTGWCRRRPYTQHLSCSHSTFRGNARPPEHNPPYIEARPSYHARSGRGGREWQRAGV